jgi:hypothetical protein
MAIENALLDQAFRRLYVTVSAGRLFDQAVDAGSVFVSADLGGAKAESEPQRSSASMVWNWKCELEPTATCTHCVLAVVRRRFMANETIGQAVVPLASLADQHAHVLTVTLAPPALPHDTVGELTLTLLYADYQQLRRSVLGDASTHDHGFRRAASLEAATSSSPFLFGGGGGGGGPPRALPVPARFVTAEHSSAAPISSTHASSTADVVSVATSPDLRDGRGTLWGMSPGCGSRAMTTTSASAAHQQHHHHQQQHQQHQHQHKQEQLELGFLYEEDQGQLRTELNYERAELLRCKTEAASARFARHILRAMVSRLVAKRRALQAEVRHMEGERAMLTVQLQLLLSKADADADAAAADAASGAMVAAGDGPYAMPVNAEAASLRLLDEAESRHARLLAQRRKEHLTTVGSLQREYISALHTIKDDAFGGDVSVARSDFRALELLGSPAAARTGDAAAIRPGDGDDDQEEEALEAAGGLAGGGGAPRRARFAAATSGGGLSSSSSPPAAASPGFGADEMRRAHDRLQREVFVLEQQLQRTKDQVLRGENALATAEASALQLRGAAVAAEEARARAEARCAEAEAKAARTADDLARARKEAAGLRGAMAGAGDAERAWHEERSELRAALIEMGERREAELRSLHYEHERVVRGLEERLAFEAASREYDRTEAQQLSEALKAAHRGGGAPGGIPGGAPAGSSGVGAVAEARPSASTAAAAAGKRAATPPGPASVGGGGGSAPLAAAATTPKAPKPPPPPPQTPLQTPPPQRPSQTPPPQRPPQPPPPPAASDSPAGPSASNAGAAPGSGFGRKAVQRASPAATSAGGGAAAEGTPPAGATPRKAGGAKKPKAAAGAARKPARRTNAASTPLGK